MLLNSQWVNEEIKKEIKNYLETNENGHKTFQNVGCSDRRSGLVKLRQNLNFKVVRILEFTLREMRSF